MKSLILSLLAIAGFAFTTPQSPQFVNVYETPQIVKIDATLNRSKCNNKAYVPINLPSNATGFIYSITAVSKKELDNPKSQLLEQVLELSRKHEATKISDFIVENKNYKPYNLYFMSGKKNAESFYDCRGCKYLEKHTHTHPRSGYMKKSSEETTFIGIENVNDLSTLRLKIEVVAILQ